MKSSEYKNMSDEELKEEFECLYDIIEVTDCYGCNDLMRYYAVQDELAKRDIKPTLRVEWNE